MRSRRAPLATVLVASVLLAGCARGPSATAWAFSVCEALGPWRAEIGSLTSRTREQMKAATTPAQAKENLVRLFAGAEAASEQARVKVERAGVPAVDGGAHVAAEFRDSLASVRDAYGRAEAAIANLGTDRPATFYTGVAGVLKTLNREYAASALDTAHLDSPELSRAFDEVPECR